MRLVALLLALLPGLASAQDWSARTVEAEGGFGAEAGQEGGLSIRCGGGEGAEVAALVSRRNELILTISPEVLEVGEEIGEVALRIGARRFDLPAPMAVEGRVTQPLDINDPLWAALRGGSSVAVLRGGEEVASLGLRGSSAAIRDLAQFCVPRWEGEVPADLPRTGGSGAAAPAPGGTVIGRDLADPVERFLTVDCASGARLSAGHRLRGDLDGDGQADHVLDSAGYYCGDIRPYCGAAFCSSFVFLSSRPMEPPMDILAIGPSVGGGELRFDLALSTCADPFTLEGCTAQSLRWDGLTLAPVPPDAPTGPPARVPEAQALAEAACEGRAEVQGAITEDLDGDGQADLVLDMGGVTCTLLQPPERIGAGECGAAHCAIHVYLSSRPGEAAEEILAIGIRRLDAEEAPAILAAGAPLGRCLEAGMRSCEFRYGVAGGALAYLGLEAVE